MNKVYYTNELTHWGIKGQKWGIRRYQNEDGTLTEAGRKRYAKNIHKQLVETEKQYTSAASKAKFFSNLEDQDSTIDFASGPFENLNGMTIREAADHFNKMAKRAESKTWELLADASEHGIDVDVNYKTPEQVKREARGKAFATNCIPLLASIGIGLSGAGFVPIIAFTGSSTFMNEGEGDIGKNEYKVRVAKDRNKGNIRMNSRP